MSDKFKLLAIKALAKQRPTKRKLVTESRIVYDETYPERMHPTLEQQLRERKHSLGKHPAFPDDDEMNFEEKIMSKRFREVLKRFKRYNSNEDVESIDFLQAQAKLIMKTHNLEEKYKSQLQKMAIDLVREEFDIDEADVEIIAKITKQISLKPDTNKENINPSTDVEFDSHDELVKANKEVYKRRLINSLIQGAAKKVNHMFHMVDNELEALEPTLPLNYSKLMSAVDYAYMVNDDTKPRMVAGMVNVQYPKVEGQRPKIIAEGICFPVLLHEIVKGVMEVLSYHGLPEDPKMAKFVLDKADFMAAETWDMRLGPGLWEKLMDAIPTEDFGLKQHVFYEIIKLPVDEFNFTMREVFLGSRKGKELVQNILNDVKDDIKSDDFDNILSKVSNDDYLTPEDLDNISTDDWF